MKTLIYISNAGLASLINASKKQDDYDSRSAGKYLQHLQTTQQQIVPGNGLPRWTMCEVTGEDDHCWPYTLEPQQLDTQAMLEQLLQSSQKEWATTAGRLIAVPSHTTSYAEAKRANQVILSAGMHTNALVSKQALASVKDIYTSLGLNGQLTIGFMGPDWQFFSIDTLLSLCDKFAGEPPVNLLHGAGVPPMAVQITLENASGHQRTFDYPTATWTAENDDMSSEFHDSETVSAYITPFRLKEILGVEFSVELTGDEWRALDSTQGALSQFLTHVYLDNVDAEKAIVQWLDAAE